MGRYPLDSFAALEDVFLQRLVAAVRPRVRSSLYGAGLAAYPAARAHSELELTVLLGAPLIFLDVGANLREEMTEAMVAQYAYTLAHSMIRAVVCERLVLNEHTVEVLAHVRRVGSEALLRLAGGVDASRRLTRERAWRVAGGAGPRWPASVASHAVAAASRVRELMHPCSVAHTVMGCAGYGGDAALAHEACLVALAMITDLAASRTTRNVLSGPVPVPSGASSRPAARETHASFADVASCAADILEEGARAASSVGAEALAMSSRRRSSHLIEIAASERSAPGSMRLSANVLI